MACFAPVDFSEVYRLAKEQAVMGLVGAGLEAAVDLKVDKQVSRPFTKIIIPLEGLNSDINAFIADIFGQMKQAGINGVLVKGQGVAQCYERPLWRTPGDVDLLLDEENYIKAKAMLVPMATKVEKENQRSLHFGLMIGKREVELHGRMCLDMTGRADAVLDKLMADTCSGGAVRIWNNGGIGVPLPSVDNDIVFVFSHILQHFFHGGVGLRQVCDWCRLIWTFRDSVDRPLLVARIREMRLISEWKAFASLAVLYLGMPQEAIPLYDSSSRWARKARSIVSYILDVGNFGKNRYTGYHKKYSYVMSKAISFFHHTGDFFCHLFIFPLDSVRVYLRMFSSGISTFAKGE